MSPCDAFAERLAAWIPEPGVDPDPWMAHAEGCADCRALLEAERAAEADLRAALHAPVPDGLEALIHRRLAAVEPPPRRARWGWALAAAAAVIMAAGGWFLRGAVRPGTLSAEVVEGQGEIRSAGGVAQQAPLRTGQRIRTLDGRALVRHADALLWLDPGGEVVVGALERGEAPALELVRGTLHFAVAPGPPFVIHTAHGRLRVAAAGGHLRALTPAELEAGLEEEDPMNPKMLALGLGVVGAAAVIVVAVQSGEVEVTNGHGSQALAAGQQGAATAGAAPAVVEERVRVLEARVSALKQERDAEKARADRLEARVKLLTSGESQAAAEPDGEEKPLRPLAEVRADVEALIKEQGMQILGLSADHALLAELARMGPGGVEVLGGLLAEGDQTQRFGAAALMEKLLDPAAIPLLERAIFSGDNDENLLVQRMASHALAKIGGEKAVPVLERVVAEGGEWGMRTNAAYGLAEMGRRSGIDWLRESYATAEDGMARMALLSAMAQVGDPSYLPDLHRALKEETEYSKRYIAVTGIAKAAREESLPVLEAIIDDPSEDKMIITEARKAYDEIKGQE